MFGHSMALSFFIRKPRFTTVQKLGLKLMELEGNVQSTQISKRPKRDLETRSGEVERSLCYEIKSTVLHGSQIHLESEDEVGRIRRDLLIKCYRTKN